LISLPFGNEGLTPQAPQGRRVHGRAEYRTSNPGRQVTDVQASWTENERGTPGAFTVQLILDNGAEEYVLHPTA
jgi:hypothetical protein